MGLLKHTYSSVASLATSAGAALARALPQALGQPQTKGQNADQSSGMMGVSTSTGGATLNPPPAGTYATYRKMRNNPTIALARAVATMPVYGGKYSFAADDDVPDDVVQHAQTMVDAIWVALLRDALYALDYGWQGFELVWAVDPATGMVNVTKAKPLLHDITTIMVDAATGEYAGLKQGDVTLAPEYTLIFTYDGEGQNYYGRSRNENVREAAWRPWVETQRKQAQHFSKNASVVPMIRYPVGTSRDKAGAEKDNFEIASAVLHNLGEGKGVAMPWVLQPWAEEALRRGGNAEALSAWQISFLETRPGYGAEYDTALRYNDALLMRGWLVPERTATEGQHGTLAEAGAHGDIAVSVSEQVFGDIVSIVQHSILNPWLVINYGPAMRGKVRIQPSPLVDADRAYMREMVKMIITNPNNLDIFFSAVDFDAALDLAGVPKAKEVVDVAQQQAAVPPAADPGNTAPPTDNPAVAAARRAVRRATSEIGKLHRGESK